MARTHHKHLTPKKYAERRPPKVERAGDKPIKQRRSNDRAALKKEWK